MKGKGFISEGDVALLLRRYTASTLLALLQEIANSGNSRLNWNALVKNSNTGIKNAREYQALWRHLAYRTSIADGFEDDSQPLEDDSDLEFEVEPLPGVSPEVAAEVAACVKVLAATGTSGGPPSKNIEASFAIDIPNSSSGWEVKGNGQNSNVVIQGATGTEMQPARKKRKLWTPEEDQELIAAVEKCGEGNWATILKGAFKHDRTAAQLSQRWALIRKRREGQTVISQSNAVGSQVHAPGSQSSTGGSQTIIAGNSILPGTADGPQVPITTVGTTGLASVGAATIANGCSTSGAVSNSSPLLITQEQNTTRILSTATTATLPPLAGKSRPPLKRAGVSGLQPGRLIGPSAAMMGALAAQATSVGGSEIRQAKSLPTASVSLPIVSSGSGRYNVSPGLRNGAINSVGRGSLKSSTGPDPMVQAAAVAAGARIAPASAAASLLKAAQSGNVVHIGPGGVSMGKGGISSQVGSSTVTNTMKVGTGAAGSRSSSGTFVHYIRTGTGSPTPSYLLGSQRSSQLKNHMGRASSAQATHPVRSGVPTQTTSNQASLNSGPLPASSQLQKGHSQASTALPAVKPRPKLQTVPTGDGCVNSLPEGPVKSTAPGEGCGVALSDAPVKPTVHGSASPAANTQTVILNASANLALENGTECKSNGQVTGPVIESSAPVSGNESSSDATSAVLPISSASPAKAGSGATTVASIPKSLSCTEQVENRDNSVSPIATTSIALQTDDLQPSKTCKLIPVSNLPARDTEGTTSQVKVERKTAMSSEVDFVSLQNL